MAETSDVSVSLPRPLAEQMEQLAQHLNTSQQALVIHALESFIARITPSDQPTSPDKHQVIHQGEIYWLQWGDGRDSESGIPHPHVVVQEDILNHSRLRTVVVCALTSNLKRASSPGNVLLDAGEANLPRQSVVEVSKLSTVGKSDLGEMIGTLDTRRINQILAGMRFLQRSYFTD